MVLRLLILIGILIALFLALRWFTRSSPAAVSKALRRLGLAALVALGLWLVLTGKLAGLFAVAAGLAPWVMRALRLHSLWKSVGQMGGARTAQASPGNRSSVDTRFFRMSLDHDTGQLDGEILEGPGTGSLLSQVNFEQAMDLWSRAQVDPPSAQVLESWLDRTWPDWREKAGTGPRDEKPAATTGAMSRDEAWEILGLQPDSSADDVKAAHRRLMRMVHPDHGGSTWLASRINQARDLLLE